MWLRISYDAGLDAISELDTQMSSRIAVVTSFASTLLLTAALASTAGGCALRDRMTGEAAAKHIRAIGKPAAATVVQIWDTGVTVNDDPVVGFVLDVKPEGQPAFQAKTKALISRLAIPRIQPGAELRVMYDPNDHAQVALDPIR
jgi:hypothetical protein